MKTHLRAMLLPLLLVACVPQVEDERPGGEGSGASSNAGGGGSTTTPPVGPSGPAVAMTRAQLDVLWEEYWKNQPSVTTVSVGGSADLDPNDLFIRISDLGASCSSPMTKLSCGGHWELSLAIPPELQAVGTYDLEDPRIMAYSGMSETGVPYSSPDDCSWGGGSIGSGTLEIVSITANEIEIVVTMDSFWDADPSGVYRAPRCP